MLEVLQAPQCWGSGDAASGSTGLPVPSRVSLTTLKMETIVPPALEKGPEIPWLREEGPGVSLRPLPSCLSC